MNVPCTCAGWEFLLATIPNTALMVFRVLVVITSAGVLEKNIIVSILAYVIFGANHIAQIADLSPNLHLSILETNPMC